MPFGMRRFYRVARLGCCCDAYGHTMGCAAIDRPISIEWIGTRPSPTSAASPSMIVHHNRKEIVNGGEVISEVFASEAESRRSL